MTSKTGKSTARFEMISSRFVVPDFVAAAEYYRDVSASKSSVILASPGAPRSSSRPRVRVYKRYEMVVEERSGFQLAFAKDIFAG